MILLLDTNVVSALRRPDRARAVAAWLGDQDEANLHISVITLGEIERGIELQAGRDAGFAADLRAWISETEALFADRILGFGAEEARRWGRLSASLGYDGPDLQIAATALIAGGAVVTGNVKHFIPTGVQVIDPFP